MTNIYDFHSNVSVGKLEKHKHHNFSLEKSEINLSDLFKEKHDYSASRQRHSN